MLAVMCLLIPDFFATGAIIPAAEMHAMDKSEFAAGFRIREWWPIFRANLGGFIAAFAIYYFASLVLSHYSSDPRCYDHSLLPPADFHTRSYHVPRTDHVRDHRTGL